MDTIKYEDFTKIELKVATVLEARPHDNADKLMILRVKIGDETRQIVSGIKKYYTPEQLVNKQVIVVMNLESRELRGQMSYGMLLAASDAEGNLALLTPDKIIADGSMVR